MTISKYKYCYVEKKDILGSFSFTITEYHRLYNIKE